MNDPVGVPNFTPLQSHQKSKKKGKFFLFFIPFLVVLVAIVSLISYLPVSKRLQTTKTPAEGTKGIYCPSDYRFGWLLYYQFTNPDACNACANDPNGCLLPHVGELQKCFDNSGTICQSAGQCNAGEGCNITTALPACSVVQLDCVNKSFSEATSENRGSIGPGSQGSNCFCPGPTNTPAATPTTPPTATPTTPPNTPTTVPSATPTPTPTITPTPPPGAISTPAPTVPVPTSPGMLNCGSKGCDNNSTGLNKCKDGLTCVKANNENVWYCSMSQFTTSCQSSPSFDSCCSIPNNSTATPTPIKPTILQTGESRQWYLIPLAIILGGLFL